MRSNGVRGVFIVSGQQGGTIGFVEFHRVQTTIIVIKHVLDRVHAFIDPLELHSF